MNRRTFLSTSGTLGLASVVNASGAETPLASPLDDSPKFTAGSPPGAVLAGHPIVSGPAPDSIAVLQPVQRHATGYLEYALDDGPFQRVDASRAGLLLFEAHVLKFLLPPLPAGRLIRYRVTARSIGWVPVKEFVYGKIVPGNPETGPVHQFRTLDRETASTRFIVWNGDQSNDIHLESNMAGQFLAPNGLAIADRWPLAHVRGNHDVRGPAARNLPQFSGTPGDRDYYAFRSAPSPHWSWIPVKTKTTTAPTWVASPPLPPCAMNKRRGCGYKPGTLTRG